MSRFPGAIYWADGTRIGRKGRDLTPAQTYTLKHRAVVSRPRPLTVIGEDLGVEVERIWVLADDAEFEDIPPSIADHMIACILCGMPLLLLANQADVVRNVREMMLASCLIAEDMARREVAAA